MVRKPKTIREKEGSQGKYKKSVTNKNEGKKVYIQGVLPMIGWHFLTNRGSHVCCSLSPAMIDGRIAILWKKSVATRRAKLEPSMGES